MDTLARDIYFNTVNVLYGSRKIAVQQKAHLQPPQGCAGQGGWGRGTLFKGPGTQSSDEQGRGHHMSLIGLHCRNCWFSQLPVCSWLAKVRGAGAELHFSPKCLSCALPRGMQGCPRALQSHWSPRLHSEGQPRTLLTAAERTPAPTTLMWRTSPTGPRGCDRPRPLLAGQPLQEPWLGLRVISSAT